MNVCEAESLEGVIFGFWQSVSDVIMVEKICDAESIEWKNNNIDIQNNDCLLEEKVYLIVIPNCQQLYNYKTMKIINAALEFCQSLCIHFGKKFTLTHYHPTYKNAPKMLHPKHNSPFPCFGLEFKSEYEEKFESIFDEVDQQYMNDEILEQQRDMLECLFRNISASSTSDNLNNAAHQNIEKLSDNDVIKLSHDWIEQTKLKLNEFGYSHKLFRNLGDINKWTIIDNDNTEEVYTEVWKAITELMDATTNSAAEDEPFSTMLVFKKFQVNNSQTFKRFAITINATLKLIMDANVSIIHLSRFFSFTKISLISPLLHKMQQYMEMEIFHPEYVGKKEKRNYIRRSPFPSMQFIFHKKKTIQNLEI